MNTDIESGGHAPLNRGERRRHSRSQLICTLVAIALSAVVWVAPAAARAPAAQIAAWERIDSWFAPPFDKFEATLGSERATASYAGPVALPAATKRMSAAARAVIPAIRLFDERLARTHFTGALAIDVASLRSANQALIGILAKLDVASFKAQFLVPGNSVAWPVSLAQRYNQLTTALYGDLGRVRVFVL